MSPEPHPRTFGRTRLQSARAALLLALLGGAAIGLVNWQIVRPRGPLGTAYRATGHHPLLPLMLALPVVFALALVGYRKSVRTAEQFRIMAEGLEVRGFYGRYVLQWSNIAEAATTAGGSLGVRVRSREAVLETHEGTAQQREWLRTLTPFGDWDYSYPRADLGCPADQVLEWMRACGLNDER